MDLDLQGNIEKFTLPEIFQLIAASRKSGTLGIQRDDSIVMVYFDRGDIVYGYGPRQTFHLGQLLKERGLLTATQLEEAVNTQARTENSRRLGEILVNKGFIDRADLQKVIQHQVEELLFSLLSWQNGSFKFYENQFPTDEEITVRLSVENVILEGLRRLDEQNLIKEALPDPHAVYVISNSFSGRKRAVTMEASEWNTMALVNGLRSIEEICTVSTMGREETLRHMAELKLAGLIVLSDKPVTRPSPTSSNLDTMVNRLAGLFEDYLTAKSGTRPAVRQITKTYIGESQ